MDKKSHNGYMVFAWSGLLGALLQTMGLVRYALRLPEDWVGLSLYAISIVAFALLALVGFLRAYRTDA